MKKFLLILPVVLAIIVFVTMSLNAASIQLTDRWDTVDVKGGEYIVQNNVWNDSVSNGAQSITVDDSTGSFSVTNANFSVAKNGAPGSYPSIYKGSHWGANTVNSGLPLQVSNVSTANTSWSISPISSGAWNCAYDVWINKTSTWASTASPDGLELMIWINHNGSIQPIGSKVATVNIAGASWDLWYGPAGAWNTASFVRSEKTSSVNFDMREFLNECLSRGYIQNSWYLVGVEAGFEIWENGTGLKSNSFSFSATSGTPSSPRTTQAPQTTSTTTVPSVTTQAPTTTTVPSTNSGVAGLSATYKVVNNWSSGGTVEVTIKNNSSSSVNNWNVDWTFPGDQKISNLWNGTYTQSGQSVNVKNMPYNGNISPNGSISFGFVYTGSNGTPSNITVK